MLCSQMAEQKPQRSRVGVARRGTSEVPVVLVLVLGGALPRTLFRAMTLFAAGHLTSFFLTIGACTERPRCRHTPS